MLRERPQSMHALLLACQISYVGDATSVAKMFQAEDAEEFAFAGNYVHKP
jgi:hypothetical protein